MLLNQLYKSTHTASKYPVSDNDPAASTLSGHASQLSETLLCFLWGSY